MRKAPNSHINVTPSILTDPVGVDTVVKVLQSQLSNDLPWLEKSFNRATIMSRNNSDGDTEVYPISFIADDKDYFNLIGLDNWSAYSFFVAEGVESPVDYNQFQDNVYERDLSLYVWINLDKADVIAPFEYPEVLKQQVILSLRTAVLLNDDTIDDPEIIDNPLDVFDSFTVDTAATQFMYHPYKVYRFDMLATYTDTIVCT